MSDSLPSSSLSSEESLASRVLWCLLILATLYVCYFSNLGVIGFVGPDEPRYTWVARAMAETGDWVTPRLYGQPWFEKPVLYYWEAAVSFKIFGVSEAAARLPSAFSALLGTLALAWLAWRIYGRDTARWLLILLPSTVGMIGFSHAAATDMPFAAMITVAMVCAAVCLRLVQNDKTPILPRTPWLGLICFGFFLGLAVLAKGPAAIILCGGAIFFWAILTKRWRDAFRLLHPAAILAFGATALPWYVLCARRNPDFFRVFIIEHNFKRYLTPEFQHIQPLWYYVPVLLVAFLPWIGLFLWSGVVGTAQILRRRTVGDVALLLICWAAFCVLFFSTSHSKLPGYILPAFPPIGLLVARSYVSMSAVHKISFGFGQAAAVVLFFSASLAETVTKIPARSTAEFATHAARLALILALANLTLRRCATPTERASTRNILVALTVVPILVIVMFSGRFLPSVLGRDPSGRSIARELQHQGISGRLLSVTGMNRALRYGLSFYLHEEVRDWTSETNGYLLSNAPNCEQVVGPGLFCEERPFDSRSTGRFLYLVIPIAGEKRR